MLKQNTDTVTVKNLSIEIVACSADTHLLSYTRLDPELRFYIMLHGTPFYDSRAISNALCHQYLRISIMRPYYRLTTSALIQSELGHSHLGRDSCFNNRLERRFHWSLSGNAPLSASGVIPAIL